MAVLARQFYADSRPHGANPHARAMLIRDGRD
jgi:hypothetical protein